MYGVHRTSSGRSRKRGQSQAHSQGAPSQPMSVSIASSLAAPSISKTLLSSSSGSKLDRLSRPVRDDPGPEDGGDHVADVPVAARGAGVQMERVAMARAHQADDALRVGLAEVGLFRSTAPLDVHRVPFRSLRAKVLA